jgi:hypothetical protein
VMRSRFLGRLLLALLAVVCVWLLVVEQAA